MNLEDLSRMSEGELRQKADEKLAPRPVKIGAAEMTIRPDLSEAQFFIDEIERRAGDVERRRQSKIATRDLILELVVIFLIGAEIIFGVAGGNQQLAVLQTLNTSAGQQLELLRKMNTNAETTANILSALKNEQQKAVIAQQQSLQLIGQMNGSLRTTLGLNFAPALTVIYNEPQKQFDYHNFGKTSIFLWGQKWGDAPAEHQPEPRILAPGVSYSLSAVPNLEDASKRVVAKGQQEQKRLDVYLKTADGKKYTASFYVIALFKEDTLAFNTQQIGIRGGGW